MVISSKRKAPSLPIISYNLPTMQEKTKEYPCQKPMDQNVHSRQWSRQAMTKALDSLFVVAKQGNYPIS